MYRTTIAAGLAALALSLGACDYTGGKTGPSPEATSTSPADPSYTTSKNIVPPENSRSVSAPSAIAPAVLRHETCEKYLPRFETIRKDSGQVGVDRAVSDALNEFPDTPDWQVFTEEQRQAASQGARDAGTGKCD
ncbi:hypothetical protein [Nocardia yamanashiensis]|uniref:hypothetical protein n=1 Tax=Nocardia yamanashiensis TaxID=209247 RepID=UPI00082AF44D|nr:hypothetical protein [Nocardia yamanashiensis]